MDTRDPESTRYGDQHSVANHTALNHRDQVCDPKIVRCAEQPLCELETATTLVSKTNRDELIGYSRRPLSAECR